MVKKCILLFMVALFFVPRDVLAVDSNLEAQCLADKTCILVCNYINTYDAHFGATPDANISIYYHIVDEKWILTWEEPLTSSYKVHSKGPNTLSYIFSNKGFAQNVYYQYKPSVENFACPAHGYIDFNKWWPYNEMCFDDNGSYCSSRNDLGTTFKGGDYVSDEKTYDFNEELKTYFSNWSYGEDITCDQIINGKIKAEDVSNKFISDVKNKFLYGYDVVPSFFTSSEAFSSVATTAFSSFDEKKNQCVQEINEKKETGELTEEEAREQTNTVNEFDTDKIAATVNKSISNFTYNATDEYWGNPIEKCEDLFDFDSEGSVGWILQTILNYIRVIGPVAVVLLSALDFIKAIFSSDEKAMKESQSKLAIRLVAAVALFLIPTIVELLLNLINSSVCIPK